jgi:NAD(P)-dependent dehydrogenase (short-subunit alcohol dehydrogenase family)
LQSAESKLCLHQTDTWVPGDALAFAWQSQVLLTTRKVTKQRMEIEGRVSLVTGGAGGIGRSICEKLASRGSFVYVCDIAGAIDVAKRINATSEAPRATAARCDISDRAALEALYGRVAQEHGGVDILINNAAVYGPSEGHRFPELSYEDFKKTIQVDLSGAMYCTLLALPHMKEQGWGRIGFVAAPMSSSGIPAPYLAGKAGFIGLTKYIAQRFAGNGISTFALALRHVDTPLIRKVMASRGHDPNVAIKSLHERSLTGRMIAPEEIADIFAHAISTATPSISGTVILADGGITYLR